MSRVKPQGTEESGATGVVERTRSACVPVAEGPPAGQLASWARWSWRHWGWDPKETWAFITWVLYAAHLHALSTVGWRRGASLLAVAGFLAFLLNFFGVNLWIPGLHSYAGV